MKLKKTLLYICFIISNALIAQSSGRVYYYVILNKVDSKISDIEVTEIRKVAEKQIFILDFNANQSHFKLKQNSENTFYNKMASLSFTCSYEFFYDKVNALRLFKKNDGLLIKKTKGLNWEVTSESKMIGNYNCYKATCSLDYIARDNTLKNRTITAWFAPNLSFQFGPKEYNNLPGLILELQDWDTNFVATKIDFFESETIIEFPNGKTITEEDYIKRISQN